MGVLASLAGCAGPQPGPERVTVPPGASFGAVTDSLAAHGVIVHRRWFKLLARVRRVDRSVQAGVYEFPPGTSPWEVLDVLAKGAAVSQSSPCPRDSPSPRWRPWSPSDSAFLQDSVLAAARDGAAASAMLGFPVRIFEGFLRPETYPCPSCLRADELVRIMAEELQVRMGPGLDDRGSTPSG